MSARKGKRCAAVLLALEHGPRSTSSLIKSLSLPWGAVTGVLEALSMQHLVEQDAVGHWQLTHHPDVQAALTEAREIMAAEACATVQASEQHNVPSGTSPHKPGISPGNLPASSPGAGSD